MSGQKYNHVQISPTQINSYDDDDNLVTTHTFDNPIVNYDSDKLDEEVFSNIHYSIYDASEQGDYDRFINIAPLASTNDLEWAMEIASNVQIVKYIINVRNVTGFWFSCYTNALKHKYIPIIEYFESERLIDVLNGLKSEIYTCVYNSDFDVVTETFKIKTRTTENNISDSNNSEDDYQQAQDYIQKYHMYRDRYVLLKNILRSNETLLKRWNDSKLERKAEYFNIIDCNYYYSFRENDQDIQNRYESKFPAFCMNYLNKYLDRYAHYESIPCPENIVLGAIYNDDSNTSFTERLENDRLICYHLYKRRLAKLFEIYGSNLKIMDTYRKLQSSLNSP